MKYSFLKPLFQTFEGLTPCGDIINPKIVQKGPDWYFMYQSCLKDEIQNKKYIEVNYSFMETFSQNVEVLTQRGHVINPKLARKMARGSCYVKIESKALKFVHPVQLVVKILKSGTIITLVQKYFLKNF